MPSPNTSATEFRLVTLKAGMTLDGKIAPPPEDIRGWTAIGAGGPTGGWITSDERAPMCSSFGISTTPFWSAWVP